MKEKFCLMNAVRTAAKYHSGEIRTIENWDHLFNSKTTNPLKKSSIFGQFIHACINGSLSSVKELFNSNAKPIQFYNPYSFSLVDFDVNFKDASGLSALFIACMTSNIELASYLLDYGADINQCVKDDISILMLCLMQYYKLLNDSLLASDSDVEVHKIEINTDPTLCCESPEIQKSRQNKEIFYLAELKWLLQTGASNLVDESQPRLPWMQRIEYHRKRSKSLAKFHMIFQ
ncbi:hypothetical protein Ciccas_001568 [Cichlidogyrus casuarinus]|uniref:Ankyrin repeat protein n=1 Tax=Cichlidogyrus casuarinus TaxID=1844966 RepID=A0ABD2QK74_9PLAT